MAECRMGVKGIIEYIIISTINWNHSIFYDHFLVEPLGMME